MVTPPWLEFPDRPVVLAFGGNALLPGADRDPDAVARRASEFADAMLALLPDHAGLVLVHGNGPQVGNQLLRVEAAVPEVGPDPLDVLVGETQGSIGYLLGRSIRNALVERHRDVEVATVVTQVEVDPADPAFGRPTKPVGPWYPPDRRSDLEERGWDVVEVAGRGLRRVVPSPVPRAVVEIHTIRDAARHGHVVIAGGGGGIPVTRDDDGVLHGIEAVIDKDRTAALLARSIRSAGFVILTEVAHASRRFGRPDEQRIPLLSVDEARALLDAGEFPPGSMGPKVEAAAEYATALGRPGLITSVGALRAALRGSAGTWIVPG